MIYASDASSLAQQNPGTTFPLFGFCRPAAAAKLLAVAKLLLRCSRTDQILGVSSVADTSFQAAALRAARPSCGCAERHAGGVCRGPGPLRQILGRGRRPPRRLVEMRGQFDHDGPARKAGARCECSGAPRCDVCRQEDQHHRRPRGSAHGAAHAARPDADPRRRTTSFPMFTPCSMRWRHFPTQSARARRPARRARRSPTSSTSASAARILARPWRRWRWRLGMTARARITSPMSTARISTTR